MTSAPPQPIAARFARIMADLRYAIGAACGRPALAGPLVLLPRRPLPPVLALRLYQRLGRIMQEFAALVAHLAAFGADAPSRPPRRKRAPRPEAAPDTTAEATAEATAAAAAAAAIADAPQDTTHTPPGAPPPRPNPPRAPRARHACPAMPAGCWP